VLGRVTFAAYDVSGHVCRSGSAPTAQPVTIDTRMLCNATGLTVEKGKTYDVSLVIKDGWEDGHDWTASDPNRAKGNRDRSERIWLGQDDLANDAWLPYRRLVSSNWFATIIRIGAEGFGEMVLPLRAIRAQPAHTRPVYTAAKDCEVFVYVNDSVISWQGFDRYYRNNRGTAELTITRKP